MIQISQGVIRKIRLRVTTVRLMTFVFLIGWGFLAMAGKPEADLVVTKAEWKPEKTELKVEGTAEVAAKVVVYDADTDELLGSATAAPDGKWKFKLKNAGQVPCRVSAESKEQALSCNDCHNGGTRLDFAALGYTPNHAYNGKPLCASCHKDETNEWSEEYFKKVHAKHVTDKKFDCSKCHIFTAANNKL